VNKDQSFTAADTLPAKLLQNAALMQQVRDGRIPPVHPQLIVTNRCNLKCGFCSCANRDKGEELPYFAVVKTLNNLAHLGAQAVTITGGGEPMLHPRINEIIQHAAACGLKVGLVTNGVALSRLEPDAARCITWLRVSASDEADNLHHWRTLPALFPMIDWAISYVVTAALDPRNIAAHVAFANECGMTHVRLVADLIDLAGVQGCMDRIRASLATAGVQDARVIYQARQGHEPGARRCWISLLKPVIGADGRVYPCCGVQYAQSSMALDLPANMSMGGIDALRSIWTTDTPPVPFNGAQCVRCYYGGYNAVMEAAQGTGQHAEFV
jgi:MoaA/NifB/PqqE/SkfB family radical SAM enzyme